MDLAIVLVLLLTVGPFVHIFLLWFADSVQ